MAMIRKAELEGDLTADERKELEAAERMNPVFDEDCPEMTPEMLLQFRRMSSEDRNKRTVSLRISPKTLNIAKAYGKGYTAFLSRLLDEAIRDENLVKKCM